MNVYDFDNTIYDGDSTLDFYLFSLIRKPLILRCVPQQLCGMILYIGKRIDKTRMKEMFFSFLPLIPVEEYVKLFWNKNKTKVKHWYLEQKNESDVIVSASPDFLLLPLCKSIGINNVVASIVEISSGKFKSGNCYGEEKVKRLKEKYDISKIDKFYSDSQSDLPLAKLSKESYLVNKNNVKIWNLD